MKHNAARPSVFLQNVHQAYYYRGIMLLMINKNLCNGSSMNHASVNDYLLNAHININLFLFSTPCSLLFTLREEIQFPSLPQSKWRYLTDQFFLFNCPLLCCHLFTVDLLNSGLSHDETCSKCECWIIWISNYSHDIPPYCEQNYLQINVTRQENI